MTTGTADAAVKSSQWAFLTDGPPIRKPVLLVVIGVLVMATWAIFAPDHEVCPYSNATRGNIEVVLTVA